jgi:hypothetical protein
MHVGFPFVTKAVIIPVPKAKGKRKKRKKKSDAKVGGEGGERIKKNGIAGMRGDDDFWNLEF